MMSLISQMLQDTANSMQEGRTGYEREDHGMIY